MKNIKYFKYNNTRAFERFLTAYGYKLEDVVGFKFIEQKQYQGNILKEYSVHFKDDEHGYFKVATFKDFNEYHQCRLGFKGDKLLSWFEDSDVRRYKLKDSNEYVVKC